MEIGPIPSVGAARPVRMRERNGEMPMDEALEPVARVEEDSYSGSGEEPERDLKGDVEGRETMTPPGGDGGEWSGPASADQFHGFRLIA